jgi:ribosomal protein S18 acetylase RimI-like enzyme
MQVKIRPAKLADVPAIAAIEQAGFEHPWTPAEVQRMLSDPGYSGLAAVVLPSDERPWLGGFCIYSLPKRGPVRIVNMAVHPAVRRKGVGTLLLEKLASLHLRRGRSLLADVPEQNLAAQLFFKSRDFRAYSVDDGGGQVDYRMRRSLPEESPCA